MCTDIIEGDSKKIKDGSGGIYIFIHESHIYIYIYIMDARAFFL